MSGQVGLGVQCRLPTRRRLMLAPALQVTYVSSLLLFLCVGGLLTTGWSEHRLWHTCLSASLRALDLWELEVQSLDCGVQIPGVAL